MCSPATTNPPPCVHRRNINTFSWRFAHIVAAGRPSANRFVGISRGSGSEAGAAVTPAEAEGPNAMPTSKTNKRQML